MQLGGGGICAGDFSFLHSVSESQQDDFIQQASENGGQPQSERGRMSESTAICYYHTVFILEH